MKKNFNVIQIKGVRGILYLGFIGVCLIAGFGWFPGWLCMHAWNFAASYFTQVPSIVIGQGILLWAIIAASYFTFRKEKLVVCMNASEGLNEEELKAIFADIKRQAQDDVFLKNMIKTNEAELRIKQLSESTIPELNTNNDTNNGLNNTVNTEVSNLVTHPDMNINEIARTLQNSKEDESCELQSKQ